MIESPRFSAELNVVSGYSQFVRGLASHPDFQKVLAQVQSPEDRVELLMRVLALVHAPHDPAHENPYDVALAAYLWMLSMINPSVASAAAELVLECAGCWWARTMAEKRVEA